MLPEGGTAALHGSGSDRRPVFLPGPHRERTSVSFAIGIAGNAAVAAAALGQFGFSHAGLRIATRATGQAALVPFAAWFASGRRTMLQMAVGAHAVHAPMLLLLLVRYGHPARGTAVFPLSVGGGTAGYLALAYQLGSRRPSRLADWFVFGFVHGLPIPHAWATKTGGARVYAPLAAVWVAALVARKRGGR
jgi:hypothetical protein